MSIPVITSPAEYAAVLDARRQPHQSGYYAMYSSLLDAITTDGALMQVPLDDHVVHRGDGVFDTFKCVDGAAYNLDAHLARFMQSAAGIGLAWKNGVDDIRRLTLETLRAAGRNECSGRVMLSRGPGGFGVNPYESVAPALYIVVYKLGAPFMDLHPEGARVMRSSVPAKPAFWAAIKNCNYLPNVFMKREAVDHGVDFALGYDDAGHLTEGAAENAGIVTRSGALVFPELKNILAGTTMLRVMELARGLRGAVKSVEVRGITEAEVADAAELLIVGTTLNVVAAREYNGKPVGAGKPGPVYQALQDALVADMARNPALRTQWRAESK
ncbi:MAG: aminotransferase class IV [Kiritimatiellaeota bacterium]|nr:aminotransferase class IV [Kiritimatiellota bacterium]